MDASNGKIQQPSDNSTESYEALKIEIDAHNEALKEGFTVGTPLFNQIKAEIVAREKLEQGIKKVTDAREEESGRQRKPRRKLKGSKSVRQSALLKSSPSI